MDSILDLIEIYGKAVNENRKLLKENNELRREVFLSRRILKLYRIESIFMVTSDYRDNREEIIQGIQDAIGG